MSKTIDYYFALGSVWSYMGAERLEAIAGRHKAAIDYRPVDMGALFEQTGGLPLPKRAPARQAYRLVEIERWRDFLGIPVTLKPRFFPVDISKATGMIIAARQAGHPCGQVCIALQRALWAEEKDISDPQILLDIAAAAGLDGPALLEAGESDAVKSELEDNTRRAIEAGAFGAPSYVYNGILFWGQDRLDFLDRALAAG